MSTDPSTIKLLVVIPNPGEWCTSAEDSEKSCRFWDQENTTCCFVHVPRWDRYHERWSRPQSCKDSEVKP